MLQDHVCIIQVTMLHNVCAYNKQLHYATQLQHFKMHAAV